jgi:hypothetical protein
MTAMWERFKRARPRVVAVLLCPLVAYVTWPTPWGLALGAFVGAGLLLVGFSDWRDYVLHGGPKLPARLSGSSRFRQAGPALVIIEAIGDRPASVASFLERALRADPETMARVFSKSPAELSAGLTVESAELVVDALRARGATARWQIGAPPLQP